ncbi:hypothetical protein Emag_005401 [Eimeria magna]
MFSTLEDSLVRRRPTPITQDRFYAFSDIPGTCELQFGEVQVAVHAAEVSPWLVPPLSCEGIFNGLLVRDKGRGENAALHLFVDAMWGEPAEGAAAGMPWDEGGNGNGSISRTRSLPPMRPHAAEREGQLSLSELMISPEIALPYGFLKIPGIGNQKELMGLMEKFSEGTKPREGTQNKMCYLSLGPVELQAEIKELALYLASVKLEEAVLKAASMAHPSRLGELLHLSCA